MNFKPTRDAARALAANKSWLFLLIALLAPGLFAATPAENPNSGLVVKFVSADKKFPDSSVVRSVALYVPAGQAPSPFVPAGGFSANWSGSIVAELRGDYEFQAELNGTLKLEIRGAVALEGIGTNSILQSEKPVRLGKGTNVLNVTFASPPSGDAFLRLQWKSADGLWQPIPTAALSHDETPELTPANKLHQGRELFLEHRCIRCHGPAPQNGAAELAMDAPSFENIAARRKPAWLARWIADPKSLRFNARMPKIFQGEQAKENAEAIAAYFASAGQPEKMSNLKLEGAAEGKELFETVHCDACHNAPDAGKPDPKKISLKGVSEKFSPESLVQFLNDPTEHYAWIRMPRFRLDGQQRSSLAAYLFSGQSGEGPKISSDATLAERGKKFVRTFGCLNCHAFKNADGSLAKKLENQFSAKPLAELKNFRSGCLADKFNDTSPAPNFSFTSGEREALELFLTTDRTALTRHVPAEFAQRESSNLNCRNCHGEVETIPPFEIFGTKLKPEWMTKFIGGEISDKPRPWQEDQMPAFPKFSALLAEGFATQNGFAPRTPTEPALDSSAAANGHKLVSAPPLGFGCVQCHAVGSTAAIQVFESPGINLAMAGARLQPEFFKRWVRNPASIDPLTKMPLFFTDEGKSPLVNYYDGDAAKQIDAIWNYLRLGDKMPAPKTAGQ